MTDTCAYSVIKEYEREARVDGLPAQEVLSTKQRYVSQVNTYVRRKKQADTDVKARIAAQQGAPSTSAGDYDDYGGTNGGDAPQKQTRGESPPRDPFSHRELSRPGGLKQTPAAQHVPSPRHAAQLWNIGRSVQT